MVNLGCGSVYHENWINIDLNPHSPTVEKHNILQGLPFPSNVIDVVYHSALFEHLLKEDGEQLMRETVRVLKPSGLLRVAIPDFENIARIYLEKLEAAINGEKNADLDYNWIMLEFLDQLVRTKSGGYMADYFKQDEIPNLNFVIDRIGMEGEELLELNRPKELTTLQKNRSRSLFSLFRSLLRKTRNNFVNIVIFIFYGRMALKSFEESQFRGRGEVHKWMYDRYSLTKLMNDMGFSEIKICTSDESSIPDFVTYELDTKDGIVRKPDLMYIEGVCK